MEMATRRLPRPPRSTPVWAAAAAAVLTVAAVVLFDGLAGASISHTWWLAVAAAAVGGLRVSAIGRRHRLLVAVLTAGVIAQPVLHLASEAWHHTVARLDADGDHAGAHVLLLVLHVGLAVGAVLLVALADLVLLSAAGRLARTLRVLALLLPGPSRHVAPGRCTVELGPVGDMTEWVDYALRRGPPRGAGVCA